MRTTKKPKKYKNKVLFNTFETPTRPLKSIYLVVTEELLSKLNKIEKMNIINDMHKKEKQSQAETNKQIVRLCLTGEDLVNSGIKKENEVESYYRYNVFICLNKEVKAICESKINLQISKLLKKSLEKYYHTKINSKKWADENKLVENDPKDSWRLYEPFTPNVKYTGYWYKLDINSAYPWAITKVLEGNKEKYAAFVDSLPKEIYKHYLEKTKGKFEHNEIETIIAKSWLTNLHGTLNYHRGLDHYKYGIISHELYEESIKYANDYIEDVRKKLEEAGAQVTSKRVDCLIFMAPKDFKIPNTINIGNQLGYLKIEGYSEYGYVIYDSIGGRNTNTNILKLQNDEKETEQEKLLRRIVKTSEKGFIILNQ